MPLFAEDPFADMDANGAINNDNMIKPRNVG
jgi:hypothetical protein